MSARVTSSEEQSRFTIGVRIGKPSDVVTGYVSRQLLGGRRVGIEDVDEILKYVGIRDASAHEILTAAQDAADRIRESTKTLTTKEDPSLYRDFMNESLLERVKRDVELRRRLCSTATHPDSYYRRRWFENPFIYIPLWLVFWASALGAVYLCWTFFALPFDWFDDLMWDWFGSQSTRHFFSWTATALAWSVLAVVLIFHRRIAKGAFHIVIAVIRTLRRWFGRIEEVTRP